MSSKHLELFGIEWTPANIVTVIRIAFIPAFLAVFLYPWGRASFDSLNYGMTVQAIVSCVLFGLICLTDSLDGYLARSRNEVTVFGKFIDPIADKVLVVAALLCLVELGMVPSWIPIVIITRELLVSGLRMLVSSAGVVVAASPLGKIKTALTMVALCLHILLFSPVMAGNHIFVFLAWAMMYLAVLFTVISMVDYFLKAWPLLAQNHERPSSAEAKRKDSDFDWGIAEGKFESANVAVGLLDKQNLTVSTVESCTGGLIAAALTSVSGSSKVVCGAAVTYKVEEKIRAVGVNKNTVAAHGVVSSQVAAEMAAGGLAKLGSDICISTTGVAGPLGGTDECPVGTVWIGIAVKNQPVVTKLYQFEGSRTQVRASAVDSSLKLLCDILYSCH